MAVLRYTLARHSLPLKWVEVTSDVNRTEALPAGGYEETHELDLSAWHADSTLTDLQHSIIQELGEGQSRHAHTCSMSSAWNSWLCIAGST